MTKKYFCLEDYIKRFNEVHNNKYDYSLVTNIDYKNPIIQIICPIHERMFPQHFKNHMGGQGCPTCGIKKCALSNTKTTEKFIEDARKVHGDTYDYSLVEYVGSHEEVKIICKKHGVFKQQPTVHLRPSGCDDCATEKTNALKWDTTESFIEKARKAHGDKYDYSEVVYVDHESKVKIICPIHIPFYQSPNNHIQGAGCRQCNAGLNTQIKKNWIERSKNRVGTFYVIRCYNETESFFKYGITYKGLKQRYSSKTAMPYKYEIVRLVISSDKDYIWELEKRFGLFKQHDRYNPLIKFQGHINECFSHYHHKNTPAGAIIVVDAPKKPIYIQMQLDFAS